MFLLAVFVSAAAALDKFNQGQGGGGQKEKQYRRHVQQEVGGPGQRVGHRQHVRVVRVSAHRENIRLVLKIFVCIT